MKADLDRRWRCAALGFAACALLAFPLAVRAQNTDRGELLYETHCTGCHGSVVHLRERHARTFDEIAAQVARWQASLGLNWSAPDIADVARHLDRRFYKLPGAVSSAAGAANPSQF